MQNILDKMPIEDKKEVKKILKQGKEIKHRLRKCLVCKGEMHILQTSIKRIITCPHCNIQMQTRL